MGMQLYSRKEICCSSILGGLEENMEKLVLIYGSGLKYFQVMFGLEENINGGKFAVANLSSLERE